MLAAAINNPPTVFAGNDISTSYTNNPVRLQGSASDDGIPGPLTTSWSVISGPGTVTFSNAYSPATTANFSQFGYYLLQLTATDMAAPRMRFGKISEIITHTTGPVDIANAPVNATM